MITFYLQIKNEEEGKKEFFFQNSQIFKLFLEQIRFLIIYKMLLKYVSLRQKIEWWTWKTEFW